jgi:hypothetical protein
MNVLPLLEATSFPLFFSVQSSLSFVLAPLIVIVHKNTLRRNEMQKVLWIINGLVYAKLWLPPTVTLCTWLVGCDLRKCRFNVHNLYILGQRAVGEGYLLKNIPEPLTDSQRGGGETCSIKRWKLRNPKLSLAQTP